MEKTYIVPGTAMFEDIPKIYVSGAHKGYLRITLVTEDHQYSVSCPETDCISRVYDMINTYGNYRQYLPIADSHGFDLDKALRKTIEYVWNHSTQGYPKCFRCHYKENYKNSTSFKDAFQFVDESYVNENSGDCCIGNIGCIEDIEDAKGVIEYNAKSPVSFEEYIALVKPLTLKKYDMLDKDIILLKCKIKNVQTPKLNGYGEYIQYVTVYDDDTRKIIKAYFSNGCADFDKWNNGDEIIAIGYIKNTNKRPFTITNVLKLETDTIANIPVNRNQETPGYDTWRKEVINRDKVCQCCGLDKHLEAHHQFGYAEYPELATDVNNGIVLCKFCHDKYHSIYGVKNINPRDLVEFIKDFGVVRK